MPKKDPVGRPPRDPFALSKSRRYANFFEVGDKKEKEIAVAEELIIHLTKCGEKFILPIKTVSDDPPDVEIENINGMKTGIEITEIVDKTHIEIAETIFRKSNSEYQTEMRWNSELLGKYIASKFDQKIEKIRESTHYTNFDHIILLFFSDETYITIDVVDSMLPKIILDGEELIDRAFLLLSYNPTADQKRFPSGYPVFQLPLKRSSIGSK